MRNSAGSRNAAATPATLSGAVVERNPQQPRHAARIGQLAKLCDGRPRFPAIAAHRSPPHFRARKLPAAQAHRAIAHLDHLHFIDLAPLTTLSIGHQRARHIRPEAPSLPRIIA